jgi:osmotically-inducible protein OsmY
MRRRTRSRIFIFSLVAFLCGSMMTGCALIVAGTATEGAIMTMDRRSPGSQLQDREIQWQVSSTHIPEMKRDDVHVNVNSHNQRVLLTGEVPNEAIKRSIEQQISRIANVERVDNELVIAVPSSLGDRAQDAALTARVKSALLIEKNLPVNAFKITTERKIVYLQGIASTQEVQTASQIIRAISGVSRLVLLVQPASQPR